MSTVLFYRQCWRPVALTIDSPGMAFRLCPSLASDLKDIRNLRFLICTMGDGASYVDKMKQDHVFRARTHHPSPHYCTINDSCHYWGHGSWGS